MNCAKQGVFFDLFMGTNPRVQTTLLMTVTIVISLSSSASIFRPKLLTQMSCNLSRWFCIIAAGFIVNYAQVEVGTERSMEIYVLVFLCYKQLALTTLGILV